MLLSQAQRHAGDVAAVQKQHKNTSAQGFIESSSHTAAVLPCLDPLLHTPPWCPIPAAYLAPRRACLAALPPATGRSTKLTTSSNTLSTAAAWPPSWHKSRPSRSAASTCTRGAAEGHVVDKLRRPSMCSRQKPFTMHPRQQMASLCVWRLPPTAAAAAPCGRRTAA